MAYEKVVVMIPEIKRTALGGKVTHKAGVCAFNAKSGKKITVPTENVLFQDEKSIIYRMLKRKILKGDFEIKDGFLVDSDLDCRVHASIVAMGEEKPPMTAEQKKAAKKRAAAMAAAREGNGKKKKKKVKIKKK